MCYGIIPHSESSQLYIYFFFRQAKDFLTYQLTKLIIFPEHLKVENRNAQNSFTY